MNRLFFALLIPALLPAQNTSCSLSGTVQDSAGALIPNARVTLTGEQNGFVRTASTTSEGFFAFPDLTPATFTIAIEANGFKVYKQTGILINADEHRSVGQVKLSIGQLTESITVAADAVTVNTSSGERAGTLSGEQLDQIALRGRDVFDAISLMPGVVDTSDGRDAPGNSSVSNIFVLGGRNDQKNVTVDGVTNLDTGANNSTSAMPSMDAVAEVRVLMSAYSAENGRNPTSINVITKGGGTQVHGQASYYVRNEALNANSYFSNAAGRSKQEYRYNIGSYSIGGPAILPKILPRRQNVFFFLQPGIPESSRTLSRCAEDDADCAGAPGRFFEVLQHQRQRDQCERSAQRKDEISGQPDPGIAADANRKSDPEHLPATQFCGLESRQSLQLELLCRVFGAL